MILHEMATIWVLANCPSVKVQTDFLQQLNQATLRQVNCSFAVGRKLTKSKKPFLVYCFSGELFVFELSTDQAARLSMNDNGMVYGENACRHDPIPKAEQHVSLQEVKVDDAVQLNRNTPITGTLQYESQQVLLQRLAIRVVYEPPGRNSVTKFHHLSNLVPQQGTTQFSLKPIGDLADRSGKPFSGIMPLFFRIWTANENMSHYVPASVLNELGVKIQPTIPVALGAPHALPTSPLATRRQSADSSALPDTPISDIRAVLVDVV